MLENLPQQLIEIKSFLDKATCKDKLKTAKSLGIGSQQFNKLVSDGIDQLVIMARDAILMREFIESKELVQEMNQFHVDMIEQLKKENEDGKETV